ncbi:MAG TPA: hypothetical protein EYH08_07965 [Pyrodictium sp.]|nr:hypothetical protein [Pyrodictium sp.]
MGSQKKLLFMLLIATSISLALVAYAASPTVTTDKDVYYLTENITITVQANPSSIYRLVIEYTNDTQIDISQLVEIVEVKTGTILDEYLQHNKRVMLIKTDSNGQFKMVIRTRDTIEAAGIYIVTLLDYATNNKYSSKSFIVEAEKPTTTTTTTETETTTTTEKTTTTTTKTETETATETPKTTETAKPLIIPPSELDSRVSLVMLVLSILLLMIL